MPDAFPFLLARLSKLGPTGPGGITLRSVSWVDDDVVLPVDIAGDDWRSGEELPRGEWVIRCRDVCDSRIRNVRSSTYFRLERRHPLLLPYTSPVTDLYFRGRCVDADRIAGQLFEAHEAVVADWFAFWRFINPAARPALSDFLAGGHGNLARGPTELVDRYADVLRRNGIAVSWPPPTEPPAVSRSGRQVSQSEPLQVFLLGGCFFVTPQVSAERA